MLNLRADAARSAADEPPDTVPSMATVRHRRPRPVGPATPTTTGLAATARPTTTA